jgi:hypothetical protein
LISNEVLAESLITSDASMGELTEIEEGLRIKIEVERVE